jgi:hypothetical protein
VPGLPVSGLLVPDDTDEMAGRVVFDMTVARCALPFISLRLVCSDTRR